MAAQVKQENKKAARFAKQVREFKAELYKEETEKALKVLCDEVEARANALSKSLPVEQD